MTRGIRQAGEFASLGMYEEAEKSYADIIEQVKGRLGAGSDPRLQDAYKGLLDDLYKESSMNDVLLYIVKHGKLPNPKALEAQARPLKKPLPYNQAPFAFHEQRRMQADFAERQREQSFNAGASPVRGQYKRVSAPTNPVSYGKPRDDLDLLNRMYPQPPMMPSPYMNNQFAPMGPGYQPPMGPGYQPPAVEWLGQRPAPPPPSDPDVWPKPPPLSKATTHSRKKPGSNPAKPQADKANGKQEIKRNYPQPWKAPNPPAEPVDEEKKSKFLYKVYPDGNGPDADLINMIENSVITQNPSVSFDDVAGLEEAKDCLRINIICPLTMKEYFKQIRAPPKGILLYGPPGTGKTMLAKAIATTGKTTFLYVHPTVLASKWKGDSEKLVRILFEMARFYAPSTIFIDEIDSLLSSRSSDEHEASRKVKVQFFVEIDGISSTKTNEEGEVPKVFLLGATNRPWDLDDAILRRLTKRIYIPLPNKEARNQLFHIKMKGVKVADNIDYDYLVRQTENYNSDDIEGVCKEAAMAPFARRFDKLRGKEGAEEMKDIEKEILGEEITMADFKNALKKVKSSASTQFLAKYDAWTKEKSSC